MGKMNSFTATKECPPMRHEVVFSYKNNFEIKPLECRFIRIPLEHKKE